jgi:5'-nucleotidase
VTNDDGYGAAGIDAIVAALAADSSNDVIVSAPSGNRSGSGDSTGPSERCGDLTVASATTQSGYPATSVNGCPADSVNYALTNLYSGGVGPHVVISGINEGQNISNPVATRLSGTVGAARTAARQGIPALAASQGIPHEGMPYDYPSGVAAVVDWLEEHRDGLLAGTMVAGVDNVNIPSCVAGSTIRGTLTDVPLAATGVGVLDTQDCTSTLENPANDVEAFRNGYITFSNVPLQNN